MKTFKVDGIVIVTEKEFKDIPTEDLKYFEVPQLAQIMQQGYTAEEAVEILYAAATAGVQYAEELGLGEATDFSQLSQYAKEYYYGFMWGLYYAQQQQQAQ